MPLLQSSESEYLVTARDEIEGNRHFQDISQFRGSPPVEVLQCEWNDESRGGKILFIVHKIVIEMVTKVFYLLFSYSYLKVSSSMI